jgi:membrane protease YdiL (CAAX protease family)
MIVIALFVAALALRPVAATSFLIPVMAGATVLVAERPVAEQADRYRTLIVVAIGVAAFAFVRMVTPALPARATAFALLAAAAAGLGEELLLRQALYNRLVRWGPLFAVVVAAVVFALVHVPAYGWSVVPVDVAAGLLFGWQRWTTNSVFAPAVTHASANLIGAL